MSSVPEYSQETGLRRLGLSCDYQGDDYPSVRPCRVAIAALRFPMLRSLPLLAVSRPLPSLLSPPVRCFRRLSQEEEYVVDVVKHLGCEYVLAPAEVAVLPR